jgi:hypothetical protein
MGFLRCVSPSRATLRHSCRAVALATAISWLAGCSTTHVLHLGDPAAARQIEETYLRPGTVLELAPIPGAPPPALKYDIVAPAAGGLLVSDGSGVPIFARLDDIRRLETIDRSRGARDGALAVGVPSFFLGAGLMVLLLNDSHDNGAGGSSPSVTGAALGVGAIFLAVGLAVGALYGAVAGHRDVYIVRP